MFDILFVHIRDIFLYDFFNPKTIFRMAVLNAFLFHLIKHKITVFFVHSFDMIFQSNLTFKLLGTKTLPTI